jgi:hypothetical protein
MKKQGQPLTVTFYCHLQVIKVSMSRAGPGLFNFLYVVFIKHFIRI